MLQLLKTVETSTAGIAIVPEVVDKQNVKILYCTS